MRVPRQTPRVARLPGSVSLGLLLLANGFAAHIYAQTAQDSLWRHYKEAQASLRGGEQDRARAEYMAFLAEALHRVANAKAKSGDLDAAARTFEETLALIPDTAIRLDYASVLFDAGRIQAAEVEAQRVVDAEPKDIRSRVLLGRVFFEQKDYAAAKDHFEAAVKQGEFVSVWRLLSLTYLRLQELPSARSLLQAALAHLGSTPANRIAVATVYYYGDYPDEAIAELKRVIAQNDTAPEAHYYLGLAYLARNEEAGFTKAIQEFRAQLKLQPENFPSQYMLGYIALKQRDFAEAERELKRAAKLNPNDAGTQLLLGQLYSETHREQLAEVTLRKLIASWNGSPPDATLARAHYMLGRALEERGQAEEGTKEIQESQRLRKELRHSAVLENGGDGDTSQLSGHSAKIRPSKREQEQARAFVGQISPPIGEAYFNLGVMAAHRGENSAAAQFRQKAVEWDPSLSQGQKQ
jgi:tetratricopeptide (TPR) repeat protein